MLTTRIELSQICRLATMANTWRNNSNSLAEIIYKVNIAGYQTVEGPVYPEKSTYIYACGEYTLIPIWVHNQKVWRATYIVCDGQGLPLTETEFKEIEELLKA